MVTVWSKKATLQLQQAFDFIKQDSLQNAEKVRDEIIDITIDIVNHPEKYSLDKYKTTNDGSYRSFEIHRYRISYRITKDFIRIVRMRHTSRSPLNY